MNMTIGKKMGILFNILAARWIVLALFLGLAGIFSVGMIGCDDENNNDQGHNHSSGPRQHVIIMVDNRFDPDTIMVHEGDTVTWVNEGARRHTSTGGSDCTADGSWDSGLLAPGESFSFIFEKEGTFPYYCIPHCFLDMTGIIFVE